MKMGKIMNENTDEIKHLNKLQQEELKIFKEFVKICQDNNLCYYICGGSFLGAVRHHGFIPWDDDIDVAMPRRDFERFIEISPNKLSNQLYLSTYKRDDHFTLVAQIINKNKEFTLNNSAKIVPIGAWIDILVIDGAPDPGIKRIGFGIKYMYYRMMSQFSHFNEVVNLQKKRPWYENMAIRFAQVTNIENRLNPIKIGDKFHKFLKKNSYEKSDYVATFMGAAKMKEILPKDVYGKGTNYEYEGMIIKGPDKYDEYLTHFYGDYMIPPSVEQQNKHNVKEVKNIQ